MNEREDNKPPQPCQCAEQIADILTRLEKLEREALTTEKIASLPRSSLIEDLTKKAL
jgi:hypothetical protein